MIDTFCICRLLRKRLLLSSEKKMIQLLFWVVFAEILVALLLLVKIGPLTELVIKAMDQVKMGKGPATVKTIGGTMFVIFLSSLMSIIKIQNKGAKLGTMSPMDQVLYRTHLLEASLMGFSLSLGWMIDRMHDHLQEFTELKNIAESSKQEVQIVQKEKLRLKEKEEKASKDIKQLREDISRLKQDLEKMKLECGEKEKKLETADSHVVALQKQAADLLLEYDRLLEDNQNLQAQASLGYRS